MADGSESQNTEPNPLNGEETPEMDASGKPRRVAKTILENPVAGSEPAVADSTAAGRQPDAIPQEDSDHQRRVAKTLLENEVGGFEGESLRLTGTGEQSTPTRSKRRTRPSRELAPRGRVAKTMLENRVSDSSSGLSLQDIVDASTAQDAGEQPTVRKQYVAKTMLDHSVLVDVSSRFAAKKEAKAAELAKERALEPQKPFEPIVTDKVVSKCPWVWDDPDAPERFKVCTRCQATVYNFDGIEKPEAEAIIFKRENREKVTLWRRSDGKYMTSDCPMETKRKRDRTTMIIVGTVLVAAAITVIMLLPPAPKPPAVVAPPDEMTNTETTSPSTPSSRGMRPVQNADGSFHYEANDGSYHYENGKMTGPKPAATPEPQLQQPAPVSEPESDGNYWKYSNPADAQAPGIVDPMAPPPQQPAQPSTSAPAPNTVPTPSSSPNVRNY